MLTLAIICLGYTTSVECRHWIRSERPSEGDFVPSLGKIGVPEQEPKEESQEFPIWSGPYWEPLPDVAEKAASETVSQTWNDEDYRSFWRIAQKEADAEHLDSSEALSSPCPKVFLYDLPPPFGDNTLWDQKAAFGRGSVHDYPWLFQTPNNGLSILLSARLRKSPCLTEDATKAELFVVLPSPKPKLYSEQLSFCSAMSKVNISKYLAHLTAETASKHVIVTQMEHFGWKDCKGWWSHPEGLFKKVQRVSWSPTLERKYADALAYMGPYADYFLDVDAFPNMNGMPEPSNVHWDPSFKSDPPWAAKGNRNLLMNFIGGTFHGDKKTRSLIVKQCDSYKNSTVCKSGQGGNYYTIPADITLKLSSTFCLEPAGDTPFRRSIADSIAMGCIPVLFNDASDTTSEMVWGGWRKSSRVLVPRADFVAERIDLRKLLESAPRALISKMQSVIGTHGKRFQISVSDDVGDAVSVMLNGLARKAGRRA